MLSDDRLWTAAMKEKKEYRQEAEDINRNKE